jgi:hypothetical protein
MNLPMSCATHGFVRFSRQVLRHTSAPLRSTAAGAMLITVESRSCVYFPLLLFCVNLCSATQKIPENSVNLLCCDSTRLPNIGRKFRRRCDHGVLRRVYEKTIATQGVGYILGRQNFPPAFLLLYRRKQRIFFVAGNSSHAACATLGVMIPRVFAMTRHRGRGCG